MSKQRKQHEKAEKSKHRKEERKEPFMDAFREHGTIQAAAAASNLDRTTIYRWIEEDPKFKAAFELLKNTVRPDMIDRLETTGIAKAFAGSDQMIKFFLQSWAREIYGDKFIHEISSNITATLTAETLEVMRKNIPDLCPGCGHKLNIFEAIAGEMEQILVKEKNGNGASPA